MDLGNNLKVIPAWAGATINSNTDTDSTIVIDTQGYENQVLVAVYSGTITDGAFALKARETDSADGTTGAAEVGTYTVQQSFAASDDNAVKKVAVRTTKRYLTLRITSTGVTSGGVFKGAIALLRPKDAPVA